MGFAFEKPALRLMLSSKMLTYDDQNKKLGKKNEAKKTLYNDLPCKDGFTGFNAIVTSLKSLDSDYSSKNHVRNFLCALSLKWRFKVTAIEEAKDLATLPLDELIGNLKVYEMVLDNDGVAFKTTKEKVKSLAFKAKVIREQTSDDSDSQEGSNEDIDEEEAEAFNLMARNFYKFFCKGSRFGLENLLGIECHFSSEYRKPKENKAFVGVAWSDNEDGDEPLNDATCLMAINSQEVVSKPSSSNNDLNIVDLQNENEELLRLQDEALNFLKLKKISIVLDDILSRQKLSQDKEDLLPDDWIVDSGCTKHMTGNGRLFTSYKAYDGGHVVFRSNLKGKVIFGGNISHDSITITNVEHVSGLTLNLISVGHTNMQLVQNLASNELVRNLPKLSFERNFCDTCGLRSQGNANNRTRKEVSTTRVLELLHLDLFGPSPIQRSEGDFYTLMIVDDHLN
ncbi:retrovirus-related pol polyprotein from transposon TNT 1-94 [Tanacetum coccineum]|uniref:Retrovirus-related pol polyprotein from transposon TNT 1-94 n=1 Tax=Tanacetum coccineum TaxID=301880 RepID=A0ABQ4WVA6_9ASTR